MSFVEMVHCAYCGVTLDKPISGHGPNCPYRRGETPALDAWADDEANLDAIILAGRLLLDAARRDARPFTDALWEVMTSEQATKEETG